MGTELYKDFRKFAVSNGVSGSVVDDVAKDAVGNSLTPVILEERKLNAAPIDIFSRMLYDRILFFGESVCDETCNVAIAEMLFLSSLSSKDISLYINSPGGDVMSGLGLIDTMNFINCDIATTCIGMAASMGAVLLSCGTKGKRAVLPHSRVMIHQVSGGTHGTYSDMEIAIEVAKHCKEDVYRILSENMGKPYETVEKLCDRDKWFVGQEAVEIGIVDRMITKIKTNK